MYAYLFDALRDYLDRRKSVRDLDVEIASFDWDDDSQEARTLQPKVRRLYLFTTEVMEGLRPEGELREYAARILTEGTAHIVSAGANATGTNSASTEPVPVGASRGELVFNSSGNI